MAHYIFGYLRTGYIDTALEAAFPYFNDDFIAIVRSLDSCHDSSISQALSNLKMPHKIINGSVCLTMDALRSAIADEVFPGFDEVWVCQMNPNSDLALIPIITSDGVNFSKEIPEGLSQSLHHSQCLLALGDGCGLNYATADERIVEAIEAA